MRIWLANGEVDVSDAETRAARQAGDALLGNLRPADVQSVQLRTQLCNDVQRLVTHGAESTSVTRDSHH